jgi:hypothetical protein
MNFGWFVLFLDEQGELSIRTESLSRFGVPTYRYAVALSFMVALLCIVLPFCLFSSVHQPLISITQANEIRD